MATRIELIFVPLMLSIFGFLFGATIFAFSASGFSDFLVSIVSAPLFLFFGWFYFLPVYLLTLVLYLKINPTGYTTREKVLFPITGGAFLAFFFTLSGLFNSSDGILLGSFALGGFVGGIFISSGIILSKTTNLQQFPNNNAS